MLKLKWVAKGQFFDRKAVRDALGKGALDALSKFGSYVRQRAKSSIRKRKKQASPGSPPNSHTGWLRDRIFFGYDAESKSVVIGPEKLTIARMSNPPAPNVLEFGGTATRRVGRKGMFVSKTFSYRAFPFMRPAFNAELPKFPGLFANIIGK